MTKKKGGIQFYFEIKKDTGPDLTDRIEQFLKRLTKQQTVVGVTEKKSLREEGETTNAEILHINEFGAVLDGIVIPERSLIRATFDKGVTRYQRALKKLILQEIEDKSFNVEKVYGLIGTLYHRDLIKTLKKGLAPGLAELTKALRLQARKGRKELKGDEGLKMLPLIDTGHLKAALDYEIRKRRR